MGEAFDRKHARFETSKTVRVSGGGHLQLTNLAMLNISKGGLFVETSAPPPMRTVLEVVIGTSDGDLNLKGEVVHIVDPNKAKQMGHPAGVGLQFLDLPPHVRERMQRYVDEVASEQAAQMKKSVPPDAKKLMRTARRVLDGLVSTDLYGALNIPPDSTVHVIDGRIKELTDAFNCPPKGLPKDRAERLRGLAAQVDRLRFVLLDDGRRLRYDFKYGHVREADRLAAVELSGGDVGPLREAWAAVYPHSAEKAIECAQAAFELASAGEFVFAVRSGREGLSLDPFHLELRDAVREWERKK